MKKLSELGERRAIQEILEILSIKNTAVDAGDDCAAFELDKDYLLVTTDMISQRTHIPKQMSAFQIGWFVVAINLSDIAAKGGTPLGLVLAFGLPKEKSETFLKNLTKGADACATQFNTAIIGGDTKESKEITICGTALGLVKKDEFMPRKGAKPGDIVAVTGKLGKAGAGYYALKHKIWDQSILKGLMEPLPRLKEGRILAKEKIVTSCMDISDGLSSSLYQLQELNNVGFEINQKEIPICLELKQLQKEKKGIDVYNYALHFGGDYELLFTVPYDSFDIVSKSMEKTNTALTAIGRVTKKKNIVIIAENKEEILRNKGYEHFKRRTFL